MKKFEKVLIIIVIVLAIGVALFFGLTKKPDSKPSDNPKPIKPTEHNDSSFNLNLIKTVNSSYTSNYLISPYSIEIALNMLKEGAAGNTKDEIEKTVGTRDINKVSKDVKIANAMFVKNKYKKDIKDNYYSIIKSNYDADILYDDFKTPDVINNWVNKKTDKMIDKVLDQIDPNFVLGLANAIAIDVNWENEFECTSTTSEEFTKLDGTKYDVQMMHQSYKYDTKYFETDDAKGIIIPYASEDDSNLEFVGILPTNDISAYIESLTKEKIASIDSNTNEASDKLHINLSLPRFSYSFDLLNFMDVLITMGIKDAFSSAANFKNISDNVPLVVSQAIHKTYIELNEKGTKAAAVTFFGMKENAMIPAQDFEVIDIKFDKPFAYMIRDSKTKEILFFGVTYEPNLWEGSTCEKLDY